MVPEWSTPSDEEILAEFAAAEARGRSAPDRTPRGRSVRYQPETGWTFVALDNGCEFGFPPDLDEVRGLTSEERARVRLHPLGRALFWDGTDASVYLPHLLTGRCPTAREREPVPAAHREDGAEGPIPRKRSA